MPLVVLIAGPVTSTMGGTGLAPAPGSIWDAGMAIAEPAVSTPTVTESVSTAARKVAYLTIIQP
jgi:hypothetical protein